MGSMIDKIGTTSLMTASLRARETERTDRICDDPYARMFVAATGHELPDHADGFIAYMSEQVAVRTRFLDDALTEATRAGCDQVVLVAAGMDSRAFRLPWPAGVTVFELDELDQPDILDAKDRILENQSAPPQCRCRPVPCDLRGDWVTELRQAHFDASRPTAWLLEGLLYALDEHGAETLLSALTEVSAAGSTLAFDHIEATPGLRTSLHTIDPALNTLWQGGPRNPEQWLTRHGWTPQAHELAEIAGRFDRPVPPDYDPTKPDSAHNWLVVAAR